MQRRLNPNPYASLQALLDTTRELDPQEMAELQLELGYVERALAIFEQLLLDEPKNPYYRRRCEWLARLNTATPRTIRSVGAGRPPQTPKPRRRRSTTRPGLHPVSAEARRSATPRRSQKALVPPKDPQRSIEPRAAVCLVPRPTIPVE